MYIENCPQKDVLHIFANYIIIYEGRNTAHISYSINCQSQKSEVLLSWTKQKVCEWIVGFKRFSFQIIIAIPLGKRK
jgi:hypothetical protein